VTAANPRAQWDEQAPSDEQPSQSDGVLGGDQTENEDMGEDCTDDGASDPEDM
jgi:hypothetical protein